jgi:hypothetical protein
MPHTVSIYRNMKPSALWDIGHVRDVMMAALNGYFPLSSSVYIVLRPPQPIWIPPGAELTDVANRKSISTREKLRSGTVLL